MIEQAAGTRIIGHRAPSYSITAKSLWALDVLTEVGFSYDSSIFPIRHDVYGIANAPRFPFRMDTQAGPLIECPMTTFRWGGQNLPVGGGGYLRILPTWYTRFGLRRVHDESLPLIVYLHPWEIDSDQPRIAAHLKSRFRHYTNLGKMEARVSAMLRRMPFSTFRDGGWKETAQFVNFASGAFA